ncbi:hypothetical protein B7463_g4969, partial [Scytalidium lignicola]
MEAFEAVNPPVLLHHSPSVSTTESRTKHSDHSARSYKHLRDVQSPTNDPLNVTSPSTSPLELKVAISAPTNTRAAIRLAEHALDARGKAESESRQEGG